MLVLSCDAIDVTDPNFNDQNIGVWEDWTGGNNYTYIEITSSEVSFYYYDGVYRCRILSVTYSRYTSQWRYTLQPLDQSAGTQSITMGFSRNDRWLHVRDLSLSNSSVGTQEESSEEVNEVETQIFNASDKDLTELEAPCGSYPFMEYGSKSYDMTGYLHIT